MNFDIDMIQIVFGAVILSIIHAMMPDHWIPVVMIGKAERWSRKEIFWITALIAIPHIISTILIGIIIGIIGYTLSPTHELVMGVAAPLILVVLGIMYVSLDFKGCNQHSHESFVTTNTLPKESKIAIILPLATALFFSPCVAIGSYFFVAGTRGWPGIVIVSAIYLVVTVFGMILMVSIGLRGVEKIKWSFLEHHENRVVGIVLIALGILIYFMEV
jgi:nickel/cobalt transporter (NicO) family protein